MLFYLNFVYDCDYFQPSKSPNKCKFVKENLNCESVLEPIVAFSQYRNLTINDILFIIEESSENVEWMKNANTFDHSGTNRVKRSPPDISTQPICRRNYFALLEIMRIVVNRYSRYHDCISDIRSYFETNVEMDWNDLLQNTTEDRHDGNTEVVVSGPTFLERELEMLEGVEGYMLFQDR